MRFPRDRDPLDAEWFVRHAREALVVLALALFGLAIAFGASLQGDVALAVTWFVTGVLSTGVIVWYLLLPRR